MKTRFLLPLLFLFILNSCKQEPKQKPVVKKAVAKPKISGTGEVKKTIQYSEKELLAFMDSVAKLPQKELMNRVTRQTDSIFKDKKDINRQLSETEFQQLKQAIKDSMIDIKLAKKIFGDFVPETYDYIPKGKTFIIPFFFDKNKNDFNEYAISLAYPTDMSDNNFYFFKGNTLLSKLTIYFRYDLELEHYKDSNNKTVIYYKENYVSGTGIWWYNYYFYQYDGNRLIPILNQLQEGNLQSLGLRTFWLQSEIVKKKPLTIKMVYYQKLFDTVSYKNERFIANDSTFVKYNWDAKTKTLIGDYAHSKISQAEILSCSLEENNELLFINTFYKKLKKELENPKGKRMVLYYLNEIKNSYANK